MRSRKSGSIEHTERFVSLNWLNGMANHGLELLRRALARVGEVNLVMQASFGEVGLIPLLHRKCAHDFYGRRLAVVGSSMHALNTQALVDPEQLDRREIQLLFSGSFCNCSLEVVAGDEIGQADA